MNTAGSFIVATFNLRRDFLFDLGKRWAARREGAAKLICETGADIVGVQELLPEMLSDMKTRLSGYKIIGNGRSRSLSNEHSDIMLREDDVAVDEYDTFWLSKNPKQAGSRRGLTFYPRICTSATVTLHQCGDRKIRVYNTHLDCISRTARLFGIATIAARIIADNKREPLPYIVTGDFNAKPDSVVVRMLRENKRLHMRSVIDSAVGTYHGFSGIPGDTIDYIFASNDLIVEEAYIARQSYGGIYPSDHFPIVARLRLD